MNNPRIVFTAVNRAELLDSDMPPLEPDQLRVRTAVSTISCGTERANITGDPSLTPYSAAAQATFPRILGYSSAGEVVEVGSAVQGIRPGDHVAMSWTQHRRYNVVSQQNAVRFDPQCISDAEAALAHIFTFPMAAVRKTKLSIGESAMVMGLGVLGLCAVAILRCAGAVPLIAVDPVAARREEALALGADDALDPFEPGFADKVKALTDGGVNAAIEVTGVGAGLNQCLDCMARFGRVALLGCTRDPNFTVDYYRKVHGPGITLIGAHTMARPQVDSSDGWFTQRDDIRAFLRLAAHGRLDVRHMIRQTFSPADCTAVYDRLVHDRNFPAVAQFCWDGIDEVSSW